MAARTRSRKHAKKRNPAKKTLKRRTARKKPAKKKVARKKPVKRKPVKKRPARRPAAKKRPAKKKSVKRPAAKRGLAKKTPTRKAKPQQPPALVIPPGEQPIGRVIHYYSHLNVAVISLDKGPLQIGDVIHIKGHTTDFRQTVQSMQIEHQSIVKAVPGDDFGLKVPDHAREHDIVYRVLNP
jgi:hypothetical protein